MADSPLYASCSSGTPLNTTRTHTVPSRRAEANSSGASITRCLSENFRGFLKARNILKAISSARKSRSRERPALIVRSAFAESEELTLLLQPRDELVPDELIVDL